MTNLGESPVHPSWETNPIRVPFSAFTRTGELLYESHAAVHVDRSDYPYEFVRKLFNRPPFPDHPGPPKAGDIQTGDGVRPEFCVLDHSLWITGLILSVPCAITSKGREWCERLKAQPDLNPIIHFSSEVPKFVRRVNGRR